MRHRVKSKYANTNKYRGKQLSDKEIARRIAQSYGYKHTIHSDLRLINFLTRANIFLDGFDYEQIGGRTGVSSKETDLGHTHTSITGVSDIDAAGETKIIS